MNAETINLRLTPTGVPVLPPGAPVGFFVSTQCFPKGITTMQVTADSRQIPLRTESIPANFNTDHTRVVQWRKALPFFTSNRGVLIHRVRSAISFLRYGELNHSMIRYLCGSSCSLEDGSLLSDPVGGRLVCAACEAFALTHGLPSCDQITGRHCHVGKIRSEQTCCSEHRESN